MVADSDLNYMCFPSSLKAQILNNTRVSTKNDSGHDGGSLAVKISDGFQCQAREVTAGQSDMRQCSKREVFKKIKEVEGNCSVPGLNDQCLSLFLEAHFDSTVHHLFSGEFSQHSAGARLVFTYFCYLILRLFV